MKTLENLFEDVVKSPNFLKKIAIGVVVSIIPIINFFSLRYLSQIGSTTNKSSKIVLPEWDFSFLQSKENRNREELLRKFLDGAIVFIEFLLFFVFPSAVLYPITSCVGIGGFGLCIGVLIGSPAFAYSIIYKDRIDIKNFNITLDRTFLIYKKVLSNYASVAIPSALFLCLQMLVYLIFPAWVLCSSIFVGMVFFIEYAKNIHI